MWQSEFLLPDGGIPARCENATAFGVSPTQRDPESRHHSGVAQARFREDSHDRVAIGRWSVGSLLHRWRAQAGRRAPLPEPLHAKEADSIWSAAGTATVLALIGQGRVTPAGLEAQRAARCAKVPFPCLRAIGHAHAFCSRSMRVQARPRGLELFPGMSPSYRRTLLHGVVGAKRVPTRLRQLARLIASCAQEERFGMPRSLVVSPQSTERRHDQ